MDEQHATQDSAEKLAVVKSTESSPATRKILGSDKTRECVSLVVNSNQSSGSDQLSEPNSAQLSSESAPNSPECDDNELDNFSSQTISPKKKSPSREKFASQSKQRKSKTVGQKVFNLNFNILRVIKELSLQSSEIVPLTPAKVRKLQHICNLLRKLGRKAEIYLAEELVEHVDKILYEFTHQECLRSGLSSQFALGRSASHAIDPSSCTNFKQNPLGLVVDPSMTTNYSFSRTSKYCKALTRYENEAIEQKSINIQRSLLIASKLTRIAQYAESNRLSKLASRCRNRGKIILSLLQQCIPCTGNSELLERNLCIPSNVNLGFNQTQGLLDFKCTQFPHMQPGSCALNRHCLHCIHACTTFDPIPVQSSEMFATSSYFDENSDEDFDDFNEIFSDDEMASEVFSHQMNLSMVNGSWNDVNLFNQNANRS